MTTASIDNGSGYALQTFQQTEAERFNAALAEEQYWTERKRPFHMMRPRLFQDGDMWCALYGENSIEGVVGFGKTPEEAASEFDKAWKEAIVVTLAAKTQEGQG